jgi:hypothetical protein
MKQKIISCCIEEGTIHKAKQIARLLNTSFAGIVRRSLDMALPQLQEEAKAALKQLAKEGI